MAKKRKNITAKGVRANEKKPYIPAIEAKPETDEEAWGEDGLTLRQRAFVEALVGPAGGNQSKAAEMAGYAAENRNALKATASYLLTIPNVQEAVCHALNRRKMTAEWTKNRLYELAASSMRNFVTRSPSGELIVDLEAAAAAGALGQIKEIKEEGIRAGDGGTTIIKRTIKVYDPTSVVLAIARHHKLLDDGAVGTTGDGDLPMERHPASGRVKAPPGTTPPDDEPGPVQDGAGGKA